MWIKWKYSDKLWRTQFYFYILPIWWKKPGWIAELSTPVKKEINSKSLNWKFIAEAHTNDKARQHTIDLMQSEIEMQCWILLRYLLTQKRIALIFVVENYHGMTTCRYWCFNYLNVPTLKEKQYINPSW